LLFFSHRHRRVQDADVVNLSRRIRVEAERNERNERKNPLIICDILKHLKIALKAENVHILFITHIYELSEIDLYQPKIKVI